MRKNSSNTPRDRKPGSNSTFKRDDSRKPAGNSKPFKKNYDGRSPSGASGEGSRAARPYSGRSTSNDGPQGSREKPAFGKRDDKKWGERKPRSGEESRPFRDKPGFEKRDNKKWDDRKPRGEGDSKPFRDKPGFEKRDNKKWDDRKPRGEGDSKPFRDKPGFEKRDNKKWEDRKPRGEGDRKPFRDKPGFEKRDDKKWEDRKPRGEGDRKPFRDKPAFEKRDDKKWEERKPRSGGDSRPFRDRPKPSADGRKSAFSKAVPDKKGKGRKTEDEKPPFDKLLNNAFNPVKKKSDKDDFSKPAVHEDKVFGALAETEVTEVPKRPFSPKKNTKEPGKGFGAKKHDHSGGRKKKYFEDDEEDEEVVAAPESMPLNKYIAHSGECSRRDAAELVRQGKVKVNGELIVDPGYKVKLEDLVTLVGKKLKPIKGLAYILLNKPKGYITTNEDPQGRKTVMELVAGAGVDRLFPVGRLDRETSGLLLITNDGDLTQKLCHPSYNIKKVYQVTLDKPLTKADFEKIVAGVELEDGKAIVDEIAYLESKNELGLEIHSGRNRIVRRIFESLGYVVEKLDRMMYAGLTKKNLPRGKWRFLDEREIVLLKHFKS
jgi:23S rRNA pseudouridine2605 synthase